MNNSFYFDHNYSARNDNKILELRAEYGWEGYGLFFAIIESMCENGGAVKSQALGGLALGLNVDKTYLTQVVNFCLQIYLFYEENGLIKNKRIDAHFTKRRKLSEAGAKGGRPPKKKKPPFSQDKPTQKAGEERREEDSKEKENKREGVMPSLSQGTNNIKFKKPERSELLRYFKEKGLLDLEAAHETDKFLNHYDSCGWIVGGSNKKMKDWRAAVRNWLLKREQFKKGSPSSFEDRISRAQEDSKNVTAILNAEFDESDY